MKPMQYTITPKFCRKAEKDLGHRSEMTKLMRNLMKPKLALKRNSQSYMIMTMKAAAMEKMPVVGTANTWFCWLKNSNSRRIASA